MLQRNVTIMSCLSIRSLDFDLRCGCLGIPESLWVTKGIYFVVEHI